MTVPRSTLFDRRLIGRNQRRAAGLRAHKTPRVPSRSLGDHCVPTTGRPILDDADRPAVGNFVRVVDDSRGRRSVGTFVRLIGRPQ
jgi:hypothetical protein